MLEDTNSLNPSQTSIFSINKYISESRFDIDKFSSASSNYDQ